MLLSRFFKIMDSFAPFEDNPEMVVAVSGGSDSLALTFLLDEYTKKYGGRLTAITVDHGLRKESRTEAETVHKNLSKYGIRHEILTWIGEKPKTAIEEKAREARYKLLFDYCEKNGILHLFVAHTKDEQAETFLLRLRRGSGIDGLSAIKDEVLYRNLRVLRPLLDFTRAELREYLTNIGEKWVDDPSNFDESYERVKMRGLIPKIAEYGFDVDCLNTAVKNMKRAKEAIDFLVVLAMANAVSLNPFGYILLNKEVLLSYPDEVVFRVLSRILFVLSGNHTPIRMEKIENLKQRLINLSGGVTLNGCFIKDYQKKVIFLREVSYLPDRVAFENYGKWGHFVIEATGFKGYIGALGKDGYNQIKKDVKKRVLSNIIYGLPALFDDNGVVFVPHLGYYANKLIEVHVRLDIECSLT